MTTRAWGGGSGGALGFKAGGGEEGNDPTDGPAVGPGGRVAAAHECRVQPRDATARPAIAARGVRRSNAGLRRIAPLCAASSRMPPAPPAKAVQPA